MENIKERIAALQSKAAGDQVHTGGMVALVPSREVAEQFAVEGGELPDELHVTLAFLGKSADISETAKLAIIDRINKIAQGTDKIDAHLFAVNVFNPMGEEPCVVLGLGGQGLENVHAEVSAFLGNPLPGFEMPENHKPWVPHMTLRYFRGEPIDYSLVQKVASGLPESIPLTMIRVAFGGTHTDFPLSGGPVPDEDSADDSEESSETKPVTVYEKALDSSKCKFCGSPSTRKLVGGNDKTIYTCTEHTDDGKEWFSAMTEEDNVAVEKKVVRHVRTPAGVRRYQQPIGSIIISDGSKLPNLREVRSEYEGYNQYDTGNGNYVWTTNEGNKFVAYDADSNVLGEDASEENLLKRLDAAAGKAKSGTSKPKKDPVDSYPNIERVESDYEGYEKFKGANGKNLYTYSEGRTTYIVDDDNNELGSAFTDGELYRQLNQLGSKYIPAGVNTGGDPLRDLAKRARDGDPDAKKEFRRKASEAGFVGKRDGVYHNDKKVSSSWESFAGQTYLGEIDWSRYTGKKPVVVSVGSGGSAISPTARRKAEAALHPNLKSVDSDYEGWDKFTGKDGNDYYIADNGDGTWSYADANDELGTAKGRQDALKALNDIAGGSGKGSGGSEAQKPTSKVVFELRDNPSGPGKIFVRVQTDSDGRVRSTLVSSAFGLKGPALQAELESLRKQEAEDPGSTDPKAPNFVEHWKWKDQQEKNKAKPVEQTTTATSPPTKQPNINNIAKEVTKEGETLHHPQGLRAASKKLKQGDDPKAIAGQIRTHARDLRRRADDLRRNSGGSAFTANESLRESRELRMSASIYERIADRLDGKEVPKVGANGSKEGVGGQGHIPADPDKVILAKPRELESGMMVNIGEGGWKRIGLVQKITRSNPWGGRGGIGLLEGQYTVFDPWGEPIARMSPNSTVEVDTNVPVRGDMLPKVRYERVSNYVNSEYRTIIEPAEGVRGQQNPFEDNYPDFDPDTHKIYGKPIRYEFREKKEPEIGANGVRTGRVPVVSVSVVRRERDKEGNWTEKEVQSWSVPTGMSETDKTQRSNTYVEARTRLNAIVAEERAKAGVGNWKPWSVPSQRRRDPKTRKAPNSTSGSTIKAGAMSLQTKAPVITPGGRRGNNARHGSRSNGENWVERTSSGELPEYIRIVRNGIMKKRPGTSEGQATALAVAAMKRWARGGDNVSAKVQAAAAAALAKWEAMKAEKLDTRIRSLLERKDSVEDIHARTDSAARLERRRRNTESRKRGRGNRSWEESKHPRDGGKFSSKPGKEGDESRTRSNSSSDGSADASKTKSVPDSWKKKLPIEYGAQGKHIQRLQEVLADIPGLPGTEEDGIYGAKTRGAIKAFQKQAGLNASGVLDEKTFSAIINYEPSK